MHYNFFNVFSSGCVLESVADNEDDTSHAFEMQIREENVSSNTTQDPLALSPCQPATWEEEATDARWKKLGTCSVVFLLILKEVGQGKKTKTKRKKKKKKNVQLCIKKSCLV